MTFYVKTIINNLCRAVKVSENEGLNINQFVERALMAHELDASQIKDLDFSIKDVDNMPIDDFAMICQWKNDSSFKVIIDLMVSRNKIPVIAESLRNFLTKQNYDDLSKEHDMLQFLSPKSRRKLVKSVLEFIKEEYKGNPTGDDITNVCHATISLFSSLKVDNSTIGGIDLLYNGPRKTGFLYNALNYVKRTKRKANNSLEDLMAEDETFTDEEKDGILKFFKRCVLPKDRKEVEQKMKDTKAFRREMILKNHEKYRECWQFYFVQPDLVLLDFKLMFENVNDSRLMKMWPMIKDIPFKNFGVRIDKSSYPVTRKDDNIYEMAMYLKLLPSPRYSFAKAMNSFLVYTDDPHADPINLRNTKLTSPYIIAIFSLLTNKIAYYIDIQDGVFPVPSTFSFVQTVDLLVKIHHVFNFEYGKEFSKFLHFLEYAVYEMQESKRCLTPRMLEVVNSILATANDPK